MAKNFRFRDNFLLSLAFLGDEFLNITQPYPLQAERWAGLLPPDYKKSNLKRNIYRLLKTEEIEKVVKNGQPYLRLSNRGKKIITRDFSLIALQNKPWDGYWRIIAYDIPEKYKKTRYLLQQELQTLGFGMMQKSIYISPHDLAEDIQEYLESNHLSDFAFVSVAKRIFGKSNRALAWEVWNLEKLEEKYEEWIENSQIFRQKKIELINNLRKFKIALSKFFTKTPFSLKNFASTIGLAKKQLKNLKRF
jgi:DNA-binding transcriptional regulator PaaX